MAYKTITFCGSGKTFATSTIKQRIREKKKSMRIQFRQLVRDYKTLYDSGKDIDQVDKLFKGDLIVLLQEAMQEVSNGTPLNQALGIAQVVPDARKIVNKVQINIRKVARFLKKNGYLNKMLQQQYTELMKELINIITEKVKGKEINEDVLNSDEDVEDVENEDTDEVRASASDPKYILNFSSEEDLDKLLDSADLDASKVEDFTSTRMVVKSATAPKHFSGVTSIKKRTKTFSSDLVPITLTAPRDDEKSYEEIATDAIMKAVEDGKIKEVPTDFNMDVDFTPENDLEFKIFIPESLKSDEVVNFSEPEDPITLEDNWLASGNPDLKPSYL